MREEPHPIAGGGGDVLHLGAACCFPARVVVQTAADLCGSPPVSLPVLLGEGVGVRWQWGVGKRGPSVLALLWAPRLTGLEESAWGDDEEATGHNYYNSIPGKEPPLGGLVDSRLAVTQPCALAALGGLGQVSLHSSMGQRGPGAILGVGECEEGLAYGRVTMFLLQGMSPARRDARGLPWDVGPSGTGRLCQPHCVWGPLKCPIPNKPLCNCAVVPHSYVLPDLPHPAVFIAFRSEVITFGGMLTSELQGRRSPVRLCLLPVP